MKLKNRKISLIALSLMGSVLVTSLEGADARTDLIIKNRPATGVGTAVELLDLKKNFSSKYVYAKSSNPEAMAILKKYGEKTEKKNEVRIPSEKLVNALSEINATASNALIITRTASDDSSNDLW